MLGKSAAPAFGLRLFSKCRMLPSLISHAKPIAHETKDIKTIARYISMVF